MQSHGVTKQTSFEICNNNNKSILKPQTEDYEKQRTRVVYIIIWNDSTFSVTASVVHALSSLIKYNSLKFLNVTQKLDRADLIRWHLVKEPDYVVRFNAVSYERQFQHHHMITHSQVSQQCFILDISNDDYTVLNTQLMPPI